jgi:hypothetical protein
MHSSLCLAEVVPDDGRKCRPTRRDREDRCVPRTWLRGLHIQGLSGI